LRIVNALHPDFRSAWELLCETNLVNPIYFGNHVEYYLEVNQGISYSDLSFVIMEGNAPILGCRLLKSILPTTITQLDYFGSEALILIDQAQSDVQSASELAFSYYKNLGLIQEMDNRDCEWSFIYQSYLQKTSKFVEELIKRSHQVGVSIDRVLFLASEQDKLQANLSKSVKSALKHSAQMGVTHQVIDHSSSGSLISFAVQDLRKLHFESAKRVTRSDDSWEIQEQGISSGDCFIVQASINGATVSSALFLTGGRSAYYGVSARTQKYLNVSLGHSIIWESIKYLKEREYKKLFLGKQFSDKISNPDSKVIAIEKFKGQFGGDLETHLKFSNKS